MFRERKSRVRESKEKHGYVGARSGKDPEDFQILQSSRPNFTVNQEHRYREKYPTVPFQPFHRHTPAKRHPAHTQTLTHKQYHDGDCHDNPQYLPQNLRSNPYQNQRQRKHLHKPNHLVHRLDVNPQNYECYNYGVMNPPSDDEGFIMVKRRRRNQKRTQHHGQNADFSGFNDAGNYVDCSLNRAASGSGRQVSYGTAKEPVTDSRVGNRGYSRHLWWRGLREPPRSSMGTTQKDVISLFVDGITRSTTLRDIRTLFENHGEVVDVYIAGKKRKNTNTGFSFVRYRRHQDAIKAITALHGHCLNGVNIKVTMAKYNKEGTHFEPAAVPTQKRQQSKRLASHSAHRDQRQYVEVLMGAKKHEPMKQQKEEETEEETEVNHTIKVIENTTMADRLKHAVVVKFVEFVDPKVAASLIYGTNVQFTYVSSLSPCKFILFFDDEKNLEYALCESSPLRIFACDVHRWDDSECLQDRLVWLELCNVHPKVCSPDNFRIICERWGTMLYIDHDFMGVNSLTCARVLLHTTEQQQIQSMVSIEWDTGSCKIWAREVEGGLTMDVNEIIEKRSKKYEEQEAKKEAADMTLSLTPKLDVVSNEALKTSKLSHSNQVGYGEHSGCGNRIGLHDEIKPEHQKEGQQTDYLLDSMQDSNQEPLLYQPSFDPMVQEVVLNRESVEQLCTPGVLKHSELPTVYRDNVKADFDDFSTKAQQLLASPAQPVSSLLADVEEGIPALHTVSVQQQSVIINGYASTSRKPRGRPRRNTSIPCVQPPGKPEIKTTWAAANVIGIDSKEHDVVFSELRKSIRLAKMAETKQ